MVDGNDFVFDFGKLGEQITEHEEQGWQFVQFLDAAGLFAVVRKPKN